MSEIDRDQYLIKDEPYYRPVQNEVVMYEAAYDARMPVMLKGPTGCGKIALRRIHGLEARHSR